MGELCLMDSQVQYVERYLRMARSIARNRADQAGWRGDPDEVLSDAMLGLWNAARSFDQGENGDGNPIRWAKLLIDRAITDGLRSRHGDNRYHGKADRVEVPLEDHEDTFRDNLPVDDIVNRVDVAKALASLDARHRYVLHARFYREMTWRAIGEVLGVTEGRACQLGTEAHDVLREALAT